MAAPVPSSIGTYGTAAGSVDAPDVVNADDIVVILVASASGTPACTGFTLEPGGAPGAAEIDMLWKRSTGSEPSSYSVTGTGINRAFQTLAIPGLTTTGNPFRDATVAHGTSGSGSVSLASLLTDDLILWAIYGESGTITVDNGGNTPSGWSRITPTGARRLHGFYQSQASNGSAGPFTTSMNPTGGNTVMLGALIPVQAALTQIAVTFPKLTTSMTTVSPTASLGATFPSMQMSATGIIGQSLLGVTFPVFQAALTVYANSLTQAVTFPKFTTSLTTAQTTTTSAVTFPKMTTAMVTAQTTATHAVTFPKMTVSITVVSPIQIAVVFPKFTAALSGGVQSIVGVAVTFPKFKTALSGGVQSIVHHAVTFPKFHVAFGVTTTTAPTWQEVVRSAEYLTAAAASTRNVSARVEMVDDNELVVAAIPITGGNVSCDSTVDERWAATITLGESDYMPSEVTDLLHPLSGLRARIWWTLELPSGLLAEVPIGTYYSSTPAATNNGSYGLTVKLLDVTSRIRRNKWGTGDVTDLGGMTVSAALRAVFTNRAPNFTAQITDTTETLPAIYEVGQIGRDPLSDILSIADAGAYTVYSDRMGGLVAEPRGNTDNTRTVLDLSVGPDCRMESIQRSLDETQLLNVVTVQSTSSEVDPPVFATVQDNDPASPLWVGNGFIYSDVISSDSVTTEAQCRTLATVTLAERRALIESVDCVHRSRPEIDPLNLLTVNEPKTGASGVYQLASWSINLEPGSMQRSVLTDRRIPV